MLRRNQPIRVLLLAALGTLGTLFITAAGAGDDYGHYIVRGAGGASCGTFVQAESGRMADATGTREDMIDWAQGYLSAYNNFTENVYDIYGHTDARGMEQWLYNYCWQNPLKGFPDALDAFTAANFSRRIVTGPR